MNDKFNDTGVLLVEVASDYLSNCPRSEAHQEAIHDFQTIYDLTEYGVIHITEMWDQLALVFHDKKYEDMLIYLDKEIMIQSRSMYPHYWEWRDQAQKKINMNQE